MELVTLKFDALTLHPQLQIRRKGLDQTHVEDIRRAYASKDKSKRPGPGRVYDVDGIKYVSRGHHRIAGAKAHGLDKLVFEVAVGTFEEARLDAIASNAGNGLKYTNEDKRTAVEDCLDLRPDWTQEDVAEWCGVSRNFVGDIFAERAALATEPVGESKSEFASDANSDLKKTRVSKRNRKGEGRPSKKQEDGAKVGKALKQSADRSNEVVALETGTKVEFVARIRKSLEKKGLIAEAAPEGEEAEQAPATIAFPTTVDEWGIPIQPHAEQAFAAVPKFKELVNAIRTAQRLFNEVANHPGGVFLRIPEVSSYQRGKKQDDGEYADRFVHKGLEEAVQHVKNATPLHTVCPYHYADAPHPEKCRCCLNLNWTPSISTNTPQVCIDRARAAFGVKEAA